MKHALTLWICLICIKIMQIWNQDENQTKCDEI
jgi:hypothetical protein